MDALSSANLEHFEINSVRYITANVWDIVPSNLKNTKDIETFKNSMRK